MTSSKLRIVFMGTPEIAVASLDAIVQAGYDVVGVVTVPDKPAGRGKKLSESAVKQYALTHNLHLLQPANLKDEQFISELQFLKADLQVVVAFRMLPKIVWSMPPKGTFNLHASLLPNYRGAAPINWAIMNGETLTGVTTFFLDEQIDTGNVIFKQEIPIGSEETAGELHDRMKIIGANLVLKTIEAIEKNDFQTIAQEELSLKTNFLKPAPKIFKEDCKINWEDEASVIVNKIRGLSPFPCAFSEFLSDDTGQKILLKIFNTKLLKPSTCGKIGSLETDNKTFLRIHASNGIIELTEIQQSGKTKMPITEFLKGFKFIGNWHALGL